MENHKRNEVVNGTLGLEHFEATHKYAIWWKQRNLNVNSFNL